MLLLISGLPGSGKSLRAIQTAYAWLERDPDRPLYGDIEEWKAAAPLPDRWMDVPDGSLVVIDEIQQRWRRQNSQQKLPEEVVELETHRHRGIDMILTCQNPGQLMSEVRYLVERHEHLTRRGKIGGALVTRWENHCSTSPRADSTASDAEQEAWKFPKHLYGEYKSASQHHEQTRIPKQLKYLIAIIPVIGIAIYLAYSQAMSFFDIGESDGLMATNTDDAGQVEQQGSERSSSSSGNTVSGSDTVTAVRGVHVGATCTLWDSEGNRIPVSWDQCVSSIRSGLPVDLAR